MTLKSYEYDVFISHAVEDKIGIANDLYARLRDAGLKVWYSGSELSAGDNISDTIEKGLSKSRFGVAILSPTYLDKHWTVREYFTLKAREKPDFKVILPVLYQITPQELLLRNPDMANEFSLSADKGLEAVVDKLLSTIGKEKGRDNVRKMHTTLRAAGVLTVLSAATLLLFVKPWQDHPSPTDVREAVESYCAQRQAYINTEYLQKIRARGAVIVPLTTLDSTYHTFQAAKSYYRNEYAFYDGTVWIKAKKNVEAVTQLDLDNVTPATAYAVDNAIAYYLESRTSTGQRIVTYALTAPQPTRFTVSEAPPLSNNTHAVTATYLNPIRYVEVTLTFPQSEKDTKRNQVTMIGLKPEETYLLTKEKGAWTLQPTK